MSKFVPEDYEPVADRIRAFYNDHPQGRIITDCISLDGDQVTFRASVYRDIDPDPHPAATGHAHGLLTGHKVVEKIETVSIGRALRNLNYSADGGSSREEMQEYDDVTEVQQPNYPPRNPAKKRASRKASDSSIDFARSLIDTVDDGSAIAAKVLGSTPLDIADQAQVSAVIDTLKPLKEAAMKKVTRSKGEDDSEWAQVPF